MVMPGWIGIAGIVLAIGLIIFLAMKGYSIVFIGPLAAVIVMLTNNMDLYTAAISGPTAYMAGLAKYITNYFAIFLLGSILAKYIEASGAATSIAKSIMKLTGTEKPYALLVAIFMISAVLTYGGISLFVVIFAIIPLARPIFKQMDMAWNLISIPVMLGVATFTMTMLPGTPSIQNVIPTTILGTTLTAAPVLGILGTIAALAFGLWYMKHELNKSIKKGENYSTYCLDAAEETAAADVKTPNIIASILPLVLLIAIILAGSIMKVPNIILIGLITANVVAAVAFNAFIKSHKIVINEGSQGSVFPIFFTAAAVGFGTVITSAPAFKVIADAILHMPGSPLISLSVATMVMAVITGSSSGTIAIILSAFGKAYMDMGISPDVIHRVTVVASSVLTAMPHSGVCLSFLALTKLNHKNAFKYFFLVITGSNAAALLVILLGNIILGLK
jgi:H+/gluconate symporter-like permease